MKLACVAQDRVDIAGAVKCFTRRMKVPRSGHVSELQRLGRSMPKSKRCVLTCPRQTSDVSLQVHVDSEWVRDLLGKESATGGECQMRQTLVKTHVVFTNACCIIMRRSRVQRLDSRSVHELGNPVTLPRLDDRCLDSRLQRQFSTERCAETRNWRTAWTLADKPLMVAESSRSRSFEVGRCRKRA